MARPSRDSARARSARSAGVALVVFSTFLSLLASRAHGNEIVCGLKYKLTTIKGLVEADKSVALFPDSMVRPARSNPPNPLNWFGKPTTLGRGQFGVVRLAALKGSVASDYDKELAGPDQPAPKERLFVIKRSSYEAEKVNMPAMQRIEWERVTAPRIIEAVNGGPFIIKTWATWTWPVKPKQGFKFIDINYELYAAVTPGTGDLVAEIEGKGKWFQTGQTPAIPLAKARELIAKLALAIGYIHGKGIVHRDIKPDNIIMSLTGEPMLADFGSAIHGSDLAKWTRQTIMIAAGGDRRFTAPEVRRFDCTGGSAATERKAPYGRGSDWWSLGIVAYFILIGEAPGKFVPYDNFPFIEEIVSNKNDVGGSFCSWSPKYLDETKLAKIGNANAIDFVRRLLVADPKKRLGRYSSNKLVVQGYQQVLCHPFLKSVSKKLLLQTGLRFAEAINEPIAWPSSDASNPDADWDELGITPPQPSPPNQQPPVMQDNSQAQKKKNVEDYYTTMPPIPGVTDV
ncbi:kinase-like domain-containing protein [Hyaloraphidium curvatum]|nr:kinase-like domain-containing protein [Hyaloraphidium curvatum]